MRILSVGSLSGLSNTCLHRNWALHKVAENVDEINTDKHPWSFNCKVRFWLFRHGLPVPIVENDGENSKICQLVGKNHYDIVWIDKGLTIRPETLDFVHNKSPKTKIISYSPDNMALRHNQTQQYLKSLPLYDYVVTNKSYIIGQLKDLGAKEVIFVNNSYEPTFHYPRRLSAQDYLEYGGDVVFVGAWEKERCRSICYLASNGIKVRVFGTGKWLRFKNFSQNLSIENRQLEGDNYCKALQASKISLCFLRKINGDQQTTRSVEIPACGGFMLAERTVEHLAMFEEGKDAAYFGNDQELLEKCRYYLAHDEERLAISESGRRRCESSGYSNEDMVRVVLSQICLK